MSGNQPSTTAKPKKSVALSGVPAGSTALCTVGRSGNDLHYRGYDILDIADQCEFEEIAHLLVHEKLPTRAELAACRVVITDSAARLDGFCFERSMHAFMAAILAWLTALNALWTNSKFYPPNR